MRVLEEVLVECGVSQEIHQIEVVDAAHASALGFPGSPTIRVNGRDVDPAGGKAAHGLSCRTYAVSGKLEGVPAREWIRDAICAAQGSSKA